MHVDTARLLEEHTDTVQSGLGVLVVRRYDSPARYNVTVLKDQDELGFDKCVNVGAVNSTVEGELTEFLAGTNHQHYDWERLPRDLQRFISAHHLPIEWGGKSGDWMHGRVWVLSKRPPRAPKERTAQELERALQNISNDELVAKIVDISQLILDLQHKAASREFARMVAIPMVERVEGEIQELRGLIEKEL